jgi:hypothetical protein
VTKKRRKKIRKRRNISQSRKSANIILQVAEALRGHIIDAITQGHHHIILKRKPTRISFDPKTDDQKSMKKKRSQGEVLIESREIIIVIAALTDIIQDDKMTEEIITGMMSEVIEMIEIIKIRIEEIVVNIKNETLRGLITKNAI